MAGDCLWPLKRQPESSQMGAATVWRPRGSSFQGQRGAGGQLSSWRRTSCLQTAIILPVARPQLSSTKLEAPSRSEAEAASWRRPIWPIAGRNHPSAGCQGGQMGESMNQTVCGRPEGERRPPARRPNGAQLGHLSDWPRAPAPQGSFVFGLELCCLELCCFEDCCFEDCCLEDCCKLR